MTPWKLGFWWHTQTELYCNHENLGVTHSQPKFCHNHGNALWHTQSQTLSITKQAHYIYIYRTQSLDCPIIKTFLKTFQNILFPKLLHFTVTITPTPILGKTNPLLLLPMPSTCSTLLDNLCPFCCRLHYVYIQM